MSFPIFDLFSWRIGDYGSLLTDATDDEEESTPPSSPPPVASRRKFDDEEEGEVRTLDIATQMYPAFGC
jgi:hypothetical protein